MALRRWVLFLRLRYMFFLLLKRFNDQLHPELLFFNGEVEELLFDLCQSVCILRYIHL